MFLYGDDKARALSLAVQDVLMELGMAFGHSLLIKEERIGDASASAHGSTITPEVIEACEACDTVIVAANSASGLRELAEGLACSLACQVYSLTEALSGHAMLKDGALPRGLVLHPLRMDDAEALTKALSFAYALADSESLPVTELPRGSARDLWETAQRPGLARYANVQRRESTPEQTLAELPYSLRDFGMILSSPRTAEGLTALLTALSGLPGMPYVRYYGSDLAPRLYALTKLGDQGDLGNPFGLLFAMADMLGRGLSLPQEAEALKTCIHNVLDAGWRTADISVPGEPRLSATAICELIKEQIALISELRQR